MPDLLAAVRANPLIPTTHWEPRCELCQLRRSHPDDYAWLTQTLLGANDPAVEPLTQEEIATELARRTGLSITQSQVSTHKCKHLDPSLADAVESMTGHLVLLDYLAGMEPAQMAVAYTKLALAKTGELLSKADGAKSAAPLAAAVAGLAGLLQRADKANSEAELAEIEVRLQTMKETLTEGDYQEGFAAWIRDHYPDLEPVLADQERLKALLAGLKGQQ